MDASAASTRGDFENNDVYNFFLKIENKNSTPLQNKNTTIKYTKLPEFDFDTKVSWPHQSYSLHPRIRRIISLEDPESYSSRSLNPEHLVYSKPIASVSKRKIVTISEDDEYDLHPRFSRDSKRSSVKTSSRSVGTDFKVTKPVSQRTTSRYFKETKPSAKLSNIHDEKDLKPKPKSFKNKSTVNQVSIDKNKLRNVKETDTMHCPKSVNTSKTNVRKKYIPPSDSERELSLIKTKLYNDLKSKSPKQLVEKPIEPKPPSPVKKSVILKQLINKHKPVSVIHVPLDQKNRKNTINPTAHVPKHLPQIELLKADVATVTEVVSRKDVNVNTDPPSRRSDSVSESDDYEPKIIYKCVQSTDVQTEVIKETYDSLEIPNVTLNKVQSKDKSRYLHSQSLPNLKVPPLKTTQEDDTADVYHNSTSFIISRATLTYTTQHDTYSNQTPSPLSYPINVVSVYKKELLSAESSNEKASDKGSKTKQYKNRINDIKSLDCSYFANSNKLMKPSDIISTIRVNNSLMRSGFICEQFQRELNFIDSFFESLQYLENCSLTEKCMKEDKVDALVKNPQRLDSQFHVKGAQYGNLLSKLENGAIADDSETMASKNLFLLNILIRDEQRRAKNLLFVLKRREDALKDFTKSQILYLENKKKQDNIDVPALKKKQRGALVKLQHECGEMQRMRKALLALSEKRKLTLMKTKKDLELKLRNNVHVDKIILSKKKPKRNSTLDRTSPLKCFDLSSSGCEESSTSRRNSPDTLPSPEHVSTKTSAEKSIQTGDSIYSPTVEETTNTAAKNYVIVDGGYLNILFQNLSLPQIFSGRKQYEVNEHELKNIVDTSNSQIHVNKTAAVETLMDQIKNRDTDISSSPSTARSLLDEFDQYYRRLNEDKSYEISVVEDPPTVCEVADVSTSIHDVHNVYGDCYVESSVVDSNETLLNVECEIHNTEFSACESEAEDRVALSPNGPLPVPVGASDGDSSAPDTPLWQPDKSSSSTTFTDSSGSSQSVCELASPADAPAHSEAEELRLQQLAIEKEIKELEQQQCLLVVREIPDKPPPPYTPPAEVRVQTTPRRFQADDITHARIQMYATEQVVDTCDSKDAFDIFVKDFCQESLERTKKEHSDLPWDTCNLLPPTPEPDPIKVAKSISTDLEEVLAGAKPTVVYGVSSRRTDHIDDILFAEWRRVEPGWTSLHTDEAIVKNQVFDSIFQKILTDTVDEYKRTVLSDTAT